MDPLQSPEALRRELALDLAQLTLDLIGIADPTPIADTAGAGLSLARGDWLGAGLSLAGWIPYLGDLAKVGKLPRMAATIRRAVALAAADAAFARAVAPGLLKLRALLAKLSPASFPAPVREAIEPIARELDDFAGKHAPAPPAAPRVVAAGTLSFRVLDTLEVDSFLKALGKSGAPPPVRDKVALAGGFLMHHFKDAAKATDYLRGIDLSREVKITSLSPGAMITQHFSGRLGNWYSVSGVSTYELGISAAGRQLKRFRVSRPIQVLESRSAPTVDSWTRGHRVDRPRMGGEYVTGGGIQYVLPDGAAVLQEIVR